MSEAGFVPTACARSSRRRTGFCTRAALFVGLALAACAAPARDADTERGEAFAAEVAPLPALPAWTPRFADRAKPVVAVVAENRFTELTDYVVPYGVLAESGVADTFALAIDEGPIQFFPALRGLPQATTAEFDGRFPRGADFVFVPAVHYSDAPALVAWVRTQAERGATIVGVCDGGWVLAHADLLDGRRAVGHWFSRDRLARTIDDGELVADRRYVADGRIITTTGVSASIPISLAIVESIAGTEKAREVAHRFGERDWRPSHDSDAFSLTTRHAMTAAGNWLARWRHESFGIPVSTGTDEVRLALVADALSRTYRSRAVSIGETTSAIELRNGLVLLPDRAAAEDPADAVFDLGRAAQPTRPLDVALEEIERRYGAPTARFVALQLEYPYPMLAP